MVRNTQNAMSLLQLFNFISSTGWWCFMQVQSNQYKTSFGRVYNVASLDNEGSNLSNKVYTKINNEPLVKEAMSGCKNAIRELYKKNKPLIYYMRNIYQKYLPVEEIEGCYDMAFCLALNDFDPAKKIKFRSYLSFLLVKEVLSEIPRNGEIYIPAKIRSMAFKVATYLFHSGVNSPTDVEILYAMKHYGYGYQYYKSIKEALHIVTYEVCLKPKEVASDFVMDNMSGSEGNELNNEHTSLKLNVLIEEAIDLYYSPKDKSDMKLLINNYMYSELSNETHASILSSLLGCGKSNVGNKLSKLIIVLRQYFEFKDLSLSDFL